MDTKRFESWVRARSVALSRRGAVVGLLAGTLSLSGLATTEAKKHKKKKKTKDCAGQPDFTNCGGGRQCSGGVCATPPNCGVYPAGCASGLDCCGNACDPAAGVCPASAPGNPCRDAGSCSDGATCVGFVCQ